MAGFPDFLIRIKSVDDENRPQASPEQTGPEPGKPFSSPCSEAQAFSDECPPVCLLAAQNGAAPRRPEQASRAFASVASIRSLTYRLFEALIGPNTRGWWDEDRT